MEESLLPVAILLGFAVVFPLFWSGVVLLIGAISGWTALGKLFRSDEPVGGSSVSWMRMRASARYRGVASLEAGPTGLGMQVMALFRPGHPTLRIPWDSVRLQARRSGFLGDTVLLELGPDRVPLMLPASAWEQVERSAPDAWRAGARMPSR